MRETVICTLCPNGCEIEIEYTCKTDARISGNRCDRGEGYAMSECFEPVRTFTGNVNIDGSKRKCIPVRSSTAIPRDKMMECAAALKTIRLEAPVKAGHIVLENIFGTGADIITTMNIWRDR